MQRPPVNKKPLLRDIYSEPMTWDESFKFIENLESHRFSYEEWEITRDLNISNGLDKLIKNCDPRLSH